MWRSIARCTLIAAALWRPASAATLIGSIPIPGHTYPAAMSGNSNSVFISFDGQPNGPSLASYSIATGVRDWAVDFDYRASEVLPAEKLQISDNGQLLFGLSGYSRHLRGYDAASGHFLFGFNCPDQPGDMLLFNVGTHPVFAILSKQAVHFVNGSNMNFFETEALPAADGPLNFAFDPATSTLLVPMFNAATVHGFRLSWNGTLNVVPLTPQLTNDRPVACVPQPGGQYFYTVCDGSMARHDALTMAPQLGMSSIGNPADAYFHDGHFFITSYHDPLLDEEAYRGGTMVANSGGVNAVIQWFDDTYPITVCRTDIPGFVHCIDRGIFTDAGTMGAGGLWTIDLNTGSRIQNVQLGGGNRAHWYQTSSNKLFIADPTSNSIKIYQL